MKTPVLVVSALAAVALLLWVARSAKAQTEPSGTRISHADPEAAAKLVAEKKVSVLDVRTPKEFTDGHIAGATNLNFNAPDFEERLGQLDKSKTWLVHCASGGRSTQSLVALKKLGFQSVVHLDGGLKAWQKAGKPVEK
jgi:rhodanese-related sulfurtransferase